MVGKVTTSRSAVGGEDVWCKERNVQHQEGSICSTRRRLCSAKRECTVSEALHLQWEDRVSGLRRKFALSTISHLQFEGRKCAVLLLSHLQHKDKVVQCEERVCGTTTATSAVAAQGLWHGESLHYKESHICSARRRNVLYQEGCIYSTRRGLCSVRRKCKL